MNKQILIASLGLALIVAGCATSSQQGGEAPPKHAKKVQVSIYDSTPRPKTTHLDVCDTKAPQRPYKVIALLTCEGDPDEETAVTTAILYRARLLGADAVMGADAAVIRNNGPVIFGFGSGSNTRCVFRAKAIVYEDK